MISLDNNILSQIRPLWSFANNAFLIFLNHRDVRGMAITPLRGGLLNWESDLLQASLRRAALPIKGVTYVTRSPSFQP